LYSAILLYVLQIYTATNREARKLLNDTLVSEITMKWHIHFGPNKYSNADGLLRIINDYRLAVIFLLLSVLFHFSGYVKWLYSVSQKTIPTF